MSAEPAIAKSSEDFSAPRPKGKTKEELFQERLSFLNIDAQTRKALKSAVPVIEAELPGILDGFYALVKQWPEIADLFSGQGHMDSASKAQLKHWRSISSGEFGKDYIDSVTTIGNTHNRIDLKPRWYIGGYAFIVGGLVSALARRYFAAGFTNKKKLQEFEEVTIAFLKAALLDMDMAISTYFDAGEEEREKFMSGMASDFDSNIAGFIRDMAASTEELGVTAGTLGSLAEDGALKSQELGAAAGAAAENVSAVAGASEEMLASIKEINSQVSKASSISKSAVSESQEASHAINELKGSSNKIGEVIGIIQDIAEQTNLLALNATIEAARAGDAGKGFAVVASEVKQLASQTGKATEEISEQIASIQNATENTVRVIEGVAKTINEINEIAGSISAAMEEQSAVIQEVVSNTQSAAERTTAVSNVVGGMTQAAEETKSASSNVSDAAQDLAKRADGLRGAVEVFLANLKAT